MGLLELLIGNGGSALAIAPAIVGAIIAAAAALGAAGVGAAVSAKDRAEARKRRKQALELYSGIAPASYQDLEGQLQELQQEGLIDPQGHMAILELDATGRSKAGDPDARLAQKKALEHLQGVLANDGMTDEDRSYYLRLSDNLTREINSANRAAMANMQARGVAGGGVELSAIMSSSQQARNAASRGAVDIAAVAMQRKDRAADAAGQLGGQMQSQAFAEGAQVAQLAMARRQEALRNVLAQEALRTQGFQNRLAQAAGQSQQLNINAQAADANAQRKADMWGSVGQGLVQIGTSAAQYHQNQQAIDKMGTTQQSPEAAYLNGFNSNRDATGLDDY